MSIAAPPARRYALLVSHTADEQRLLALMAELISRREYVTGEAAFPRALAVEDARAISADIHQAIDLGSRKRAELAAAQGHPIACRAGCSACCEQLVMIWAPEAELVAAWLAEPEQAAVKEAFLEAYPRWRDESAAAIALVEERTAARDAKGQLGALVAHWRQRIRCAFNRDGLCTIYPVRPAVCRNCHALDTSDRCHPADATGTAATSLHFKPLEDFLRRARALSMAMHHALGRPRGQTEALCTAVYERLRPEGVGAHG
jgi:Fe-S-cluster containining protein